MAKVAILGAGNGGVAAAAHLTLNGHEVTLTNRSHSRLDPFRMDKKIKVTGGVINDTTVEISRVTDDERTAIEDAEVIMVCVPATGHSYYAQKIAAYLKPNQIIMLNPGHTGGALHFVNELRKNGFKDIPRICETNTLTYACRMVDEKTVAIYNIAPNVLMSAFPGKDLQYVQDKILELYPTLKPVRTVLETSLTNLNAVLHPPGMVLNAGWIERTKGNFYYYYEGTTPAVGTLIGAIDRERCAIVKKLGLEPVTFLQHFYEAGYTTEEALKSGSLYKALRESKPNRWIKAPSSLRHRYLDEDVGFGLVPMSQIGDIVGIETPIIDSFIELASEINGINYWNRGLTLDKLGLKNISPTKLKQYVWEGEF